MTRIKTCLVLLIAQIPGFYFYNHFEDWTQFKAIHNKSYTSPDEDSERLKIYLKNKEDITRHNELYEKGKVSFKMKINHFGDLFDHEMHHRSRSKQYYGVRNKLVKGSSYRRLGIELKGSPPESIDWRQKGAVTGVRDQGNCGACWAFSTVAALESHSIIQTGNQSLLSEQNLIDCTLGGTYENNGCKGGYLQSAYEYAKNNGIDARKSYPFMGKVGKCKFNKENTGAYIDGYESISDENEMRRIVGLHGPVSVAVDASPKAFTLYSEGIFDLDGCNGPLTHAVTVVGYGSVNGQDFWIVKNSWGKNWGENGFMRIARNKNMCGIIEDVVYPQNLKLGAYSLGGRLWANYYSVLAVTALGLIRQLI